MQWEQVAYREVVQGYSKRDACLAILIFSVQMGILFGQGCSIPRICLCY